MVETVKESCEHIDCMYRGRFDSQPCCMFMIVTGRPRNCEVSRCDKYKAGKRVVLQDMGGFHFTRY